MTRGWQAVSVAAAGVGGMVAGLLVSSLATAHMGESSRVRANIVLGSTLSGGALGAGVTAYATGPKLQLTA